MNVEATQTHLFARQPHSLLERIAFWAFLVGGLAGLAGTIALTIASGSLSRDLVITTVLGLASAVILIIGFRWAPLVSTLLGGYNLYMVCRYPFRCCCECRWRFIRPVDDLQKVERYCLHLASRVRVPRCCAVPAL